MLIASTVIKSGSAPSVEQTKSMMVLSDSVLPAATHLDDTYLPCSPDQLKHTDVAAKTLRDLDAHDKSVEEQVRV